MNYSGDLAVIISGGLNLLGRCSNGAVPGFFKEQFRTAHRKERCCVEESSTDCR